MLFYDFEVFQHDWLVVVMDTNTQKTHVITNDPAELLKLYETNRCEIWCGFNSNYYDQYILKGILCGFDSKKVNDFIILQGQPGWRFSSLLNRYPLNNYDVMNSLDRGLKTFEGFMGNDIRETSVPFTITRKLTTAELAEVEQYCRHDVAQTMEVFLHRREDFEAHLGLVRLACAGRALDLSLIGKTKPQLSAIILNAKKQEHADEFDIDFPETMCITKYNSVLEWYKNPDNRCYMKNGKKHKLETLVAGVPHVFGWGGVHGARSKYHAKGYFLNMDVASLYPSLMIRYNLHSRNMKDPKKYEEIYHTRLQYKAEGNPLQAPLKLVLNSTYGVMKDEHNALYDPRQANRVCVYGQLLLLDLIEHLEPFAKVIQSNTDGVLVQMPEGQDEGAWFAQIDEIAHEWETRTGLRLEFDEYREIYQKDVNNYLLIDGKGKHKSKGAYVKKLTPLDYDLPIVNRALVAYMVQGTPIEETVNACDDLREFQRVTKISGKYAHILHGGRRLAEKCVRVFASIRERDGGLYKVHRTKGTAEKIASTPERCFLHNGAVHGVKVPARLDREWYIDTARKRLQDFGVDV